jgi:hypothetical protein
MFLSLLAIAAVEQGCYQRVVSAKGLGASSYEVHEPYQSNSGLDDWLFGPKEGKPTTVQPHNAQ